MLAGCSSGGASSTHAAHAPPRAPIAGPSFYVDPANPAAKQETAVAPGRPGPQTPTPWPKLARGAHRDLDRGTTRTCSRVCRALTIAATHAHKTALLVAYWIPGRDCGQFSSGGALNG